MVATRGLARRDLMAARWHLPALAAVLVLYAAVFAVGHHLSEDGFYHRYFDQVSYRYDAAHVTEAFAKDGLRAGFAVAWRHATAQGFVYPLLGGLAYLIHLDPTHVTFSLFLVSLVALWWTLADRGRVPWLGWLGVALVTALPSLLNRTGGPLDFRPDFLGQTLWTLAAALALRSDLFARRRTTIALAVTLGVAFCTRSLTFAYAAAALPPCALAAWLAGAPGRAARLRHLGAAALIAGLMAAPFFWTHFATLKAYYIDAHLSQKENAARGFLGETFSFHLAWYFDSLRRNHVGAPGLAMMLVALAGTARRGTLADLRRLAPQLLVGAAFLMPIVVMAMGPQRSSTVSGVAAGSAVLLALAPALRAVRPSFRSRRLLVVGVALGLGLWPVRFLWKCYRDHGERLAAGHQNVHVVQDAILDYAASRRGLLLSTVPLIEPYFGGQLELAGFERHGRLPHKFHHGLGHSIYAAGSGQAFADRLRHSDVVVWWDGGQSGGDLPANREAHAYRGILLDVLAHDFRPATGPARETVLEGKPVRLFFHQKAR